MNAHSACTEKCVDYCERRAKTSECKKFHVMDLRSYEIGPARGAVSDGF